MKLHVLAIRDLKADAYMTPFFAHNVGAAVRDFGDQVKDQKSGVLNRHPEDFELVSLGSYDDQTGLFETGVPKQVALGSSYKVVDIK